MSTTRFSAHRLLTVVSLAAMSLAGGTIAAPAIAQTGSSASIDVAAQPLDAALRAIEAQSGARISFDPDAVRGVTSRAVVDAPNPRAAIDAALAGSNLTVVQSADGSFDVFGGIVVTAQRDEAETSVLVRQASTSDRNGLSLREQPRNTQVISAKAIEDQQALNITDILRNAGGVSSQLNNPNAGSSYTVRGFNAGGLINGLSGAAQYGVASGANQPVANIERVEILKGPDALLSGFDNLGGNVNVVTKRPSAEPRLTASVDVGSFGLLRGVLDANSAITADDKLTARVILSNQRMDHNYGGYLGSKEFLFAPTLRFKDARTDIVVGASISDARTGLSPFSFFDLATREIYDRDPSIPIYSKDQSIHVETTRFYFDATREIVPGIEVVARGLRDQNQLGLDVYPFNYSARRNRYEVAIRGSGQQGNTNAVDSFVRVKAKLADWLSLRMNVGGNYSKGYFEPLSSTAYTTIGPVPLDENTTLPVIPRPSVNPPVFRLGSRQQGLYGQILLDAGPVKVLGGLRRNWYKSTFEFFGAPPPPPTKNVATVPNAGIIVDIARNVSVFANYLEGNSPINSTDFERNPLPNITTTNKEAGIKLDLFGKRATINASYFDVTQDNTLVADPEHPGFQLSAPGQRGRGVDVNIVGQIVPGWTVQGSYTNTDYEWLTKTAFRQVVYRQPRHTYSLYSNYRTKLGDDMSGGFGVGLFGRSRSFADQLGRFVVPEARQVDVNGFLTVGGFDVNLGVRNVFDRRNYNITTVVDFVPVDEPRNVRLSVSKRLF